MDHGNGNWFDQLNQRKNQTPTTPTNPQEQTSSGPLRFNSLLAAAPSGIRQSIYNDGEEEPIRPASHSQMVRGFTATAVVSPQQKVSLEPESLSKMTLHDDKDPKISLLDEIVPVPKPKPRTSILSVNRDAAMVANSFTLPIKLTQKESNVATAPTHPIPDTITQVKTTMTPSTAAFFPNASPTTSASSQGAVNPIMNLLNKHVAARNEEFAEKMKEHEQLKVNLNTPKPLFNKNNVHPHILEKQRNLPTYEVRSKLIDEVRKNQVIILIGGTGSGKSTQIPQYLVEAGLHGTGMIGITQPRRLACKMLAARVSEEMGVKVGTTVGYAFRFEKAVGTDTVIKYMTDGLLVRECSSGENFDAYSIIIIDEAHERSVQTDVCFGLLKRAAQRRPDLKIIISSATLEEKKISEFFNNAPVFDVKGKTYQVDIFYNPKTEYDYMEGAVETIININRRQERGDGDILVFLPGQEEIEKVGEMLSNRLGEISSLNDELKIMHCYGAMIIQEQNKIFEATPKNYRKVVLATNIAETSLTIDGIAYVIDCGFFKQKELNPKTGIQSLVTKRITRFQAIQRKGRAGRTQAGKCYRLYREYDFKFTMQEATTPEITRCNVESVVLAILNMGISNPLEFEFMDPPPEDAIFDSLVLLQELSAVAVDDTGAKLTYLGKRMAELPLDPQLARVVIASEDLGCVPEVLKIVGMLSTNYQNIFFRAKKVRQQADQVKARYNHPDGDHLTLLKVFEAWQGQNYSESWCKCNFIQYRFLLEAEEIRQQLEELLTVRWSKGYQQPVRCAPAVLHENIRKAFTTGYFRQLAKKKPIGHAYDTVGNLRHVEEVFIHPASSLFSIKPRWVIYNDVLKTTKKPNMNGVISINPNWISQYVPEFAKKLSVLGISLL